MSETAILFRSKYGASRKYALMLKERTGADAIENENMKAELIRDFSTIILIGGVYADRINGLDFIRKFRGSLSDKRLYVFAVGGTEFSPEYIAKLRKVNGLDDIPMSYGRGEINEDALSFLDRRLMGLLRRMVKRKPESEWTLTEKAIAESKGNVSWVDERYLDPVVDFISPVP